IYADGVNARILHATNATGAWVSETVTTADPLKVSWGDVSAAMDGQGKIHAVFTDGYSGDLRYATNAAGAWAVTLLDDDTRYCDVAVDAAGHPHVSYAKG